MTLTLMEQSAPLPKRPQMGHDVSFIRDKTHTGGHINLKKSVESNPAKKIQHKLDNMFLSIDGI